MKDMKDDAKIGIQSSALSLHSRLPLFLHVFSAGTFASAAACGLAMSASPLFYAALSFGVGVPLWRSVSRLEDITVSEAGRRFRESVWVGVGLGLAVWIEILYWLLQHVEL